MRKIDLTELFSKIYTPERIRKIKKIKSKKFQRVNPYLSVDPSTQWLKLTLPYFHPPFYLLKISLDFTQEGLVVFSVKKARMYPEVLPQSQLVFLPPTTKKIKVELISE